MLPVVFITGNSFVDIRKSPYYCTSCNLYFYAVYSLNQRISLSDKVIITTSESTVVEIVSDYTLFLRSP